MSDADLLPPSATVLERMLSRAFARHSSLPVGVADSRRPQTCPATLLPWLAWEFSVDTWGPGWDETQKREAVAASPAMHRRKGSASAVQHALLALGYDARIQEWFNQVPIGLPFTFWLLLEADQVGIDAAAMAQILNTIDSTKNLRSHLTRIQLTVRSRAKLYLAAVSGLGSLVTMTVPPDGIFLNEHVLITA